MRNPLRKLPLAATIYVTGDVLIKAASFFLLPIMTRFLSPEDYGVLGSVTAFVAVLSLLLQLNVNGALMRFYPEVADENARQELVGALVLFSAAWSLAVVLGLNFAGSALLDGIYKGVRFRPYLRLGTWIAFVNSLTVLPLCLLQMQQRPLMHRVLSLTAFIFNTAAVLVFVVGMRFGAFGGVVGQLTGATAASIPFLLLLRKHMRAVWSVPVLKTCLAFCLPLALYAASGWVMDMSNRVFIERFLNLGELGLFNIGNQFSMILGFILGATGLAFTPIFYETVKGEEGPQLLARFGLMYLAVTLGLGLGIAVLSREALQILTQPRYHSAYRVIPFLTATQTLNAFWHLTVNPIMLKKKTVYLTILMMISAAMSVALNLYLIPRYGIIGAAVSPLIANIFLNAAVFFFSIRLYPVPYNYSHFALTIVLAAFVFAAATIVTTSNTFVTFGARFLILGLYPTLLLIFGVIHVSDLRRIWEAL